MFILIGIAICVFLFTWLFVRTLISVVAPRNAVIAFDRGVDAVMNFVGKASILLFGFGVIFFACAIYFGWKI